MPNGEDRAISRQIRWSDSSLRAIEHNTIENKERF